MELKYQLNTTFSSETIQNELKKITNQIYKLLPCREEGGDWQLPLQTCIEELIGLNLIAIDQQEILFPLLCKLQGLFILIRPEDFYLYRRTIFECLALMNNLKEKCH